MKTRVESGPNARNFLPLEVREHPYKGQALNPHPPQPKYGASFREMELPPSGLCLLGRFSTPPPYLSQVTGHHLRGGTVVL